MPLPELLKARVEQQLSAYCERRVPRDVRHLVRLNFAIRGNTVSIFEERVVYDRPDQWVKVPIAQCRFDPDTAEWTLYCCDRNTRWFVYRYAEPARDIGALLHALDIDSTRIFWG